MEKKKGREKEKCGEKKYMSAMSRMNSDRFGEYDRGTNRPTRACDAMSELGVGTLVE